MYVGDCKRLDRIHIYAFPVCTVICSPGHCDTEKILDCYTALHSTKEKHTKE